VAAVQQRWQQQQQQRWQPLWQQQQQQQQKRWQPLWQQQQQQQHAAACSSSLWLCCGCRCRDGLHELMARVLRTRDALLLKMIRTLAQHDFQAKKMFAVRALALRFMCYFPS
jgi:hypothetical protein